MKNLGVLGALAAAVLSANTVQAQDASYPSRTLVFVVAFQAGSSSDAIVRFMADKIRPMVKQTIVVENRPGASGAVATEYTLRAKPDGHTIFVHSPAAVAANDATMKTPPANTRARLQVAATINRQAFMLAVHTNTPHKTLADLTAAMKTKGAKATYATYAMTATIAGAMYKASTGIEPVEAAYRIGAHTLNDMESGVLDFGIYDPLFALAQERAGRFRLLAIVSPERMQTSPNVPTFREQGHDIVLMGYFSAIVPAETPKPVVAEINRLFSTVVAMEETKKFLNTIGSEPWINSPEKAQELYLSEFENYRKAVAVAKIERK
ncbi:MAG: tripartite tricarboxylate transporter substrate binding protein [Alphaproteobacteria bacterium]|nr:tripartite tricarboxylate transporter substrate binding protein [Alphaproteobacteria bacterium]